MQSEDMPDLHKTLLASFGQAAECVSTSTPAPVPTTTSASPHTSNLDIVSKQDSQENASAADAVEPDADVRMLTTIAVMRMSDIMHQTPPHGDTQIEKRIVASAKVHNCFRDMRTLPAGSEEWLERVRRGCADAGEAPLEDVKMCAYALALNLYRLSWETQGGSTLPLEVMPYIDELGKLQQRDPHFTSFAVDLVVAFFAGVAARLCDIAHLDSIGPSLASWHLSRDAAASVADRTSKFDRFV